MSISTNRNVLPEDIQKTHRREYYYRLSALSVGIVGACAILGAVLLLPTLLLVSGRVEALREQNTYLAEILKREGGDEFSSKLSSVKEKIGLVKEDKSMVSTLILAEVLEKRRGGVTFDRIDFDTRGENIFVVTLSGNANTRENLLALKEALLDLDFVSNVDVPVSLLAKSRDISFTINAEGEFSKLKDNE